MEEEPSARSWKLDLRAEQCAMGIVGWNRDALTALAYALGREWDPEYYWIEFVDTDDSAPGPIERVIERRTATDHWMRLAATAELGPDERSARDALVLRSLMPQPLDAADVRRFDEYRLPPALRKFARTVHEQKRPSVGILVNMDRIAPLYPDDPEMSRRYFRAAMGTNLTLLMTYCGPARRNRGAADGVILETGPENVPLPEVAYNVERASVGPFARDSSPFRLREVPGVPDLLDAAARDV
jgi:hypothetical protein